jgi:hypothetical protein
MDSVRAAYAQHTSLLRESEALRKEQEAAGSHRAADTSLSGPAAFSSLATLEYWFGPGFTLSYLRQLGGELRFPRTSLIAALAVGAACVLNVLMARARGELLDALAGAGAAALLPVGGAARAPLSLSAALSHLWGWTAGLSALRRLVALALLEWGCLVVKDVCLGLARASRTGASRGLYFAALLRQDLSFFSEHHSAALAARLEADPETLDELLVHGPERLVQGAVALGTLGWLLSVDPALLALSLLLRLPQVLQVTEASVRIAAAYERLAAARLQDATARAVDALANARVVQAHGACAAEVAGFCGLLERYLDVVRASSLARALLRRSEGVVLLATEVALVAFGALRILQGGTSVGQFTSRRDAVGTVIENFHGLEHVCAYGGCVTAALLRRLFFLLLQSAPPTCSPAQTLWCAARTLCWGAFCPCGTACPRCPCRCPCRCRFPQRWMRASSRCMWWRSCRGRGARGLRDAAGATPRGPPLPRAAWARGAGHCPGCGGGGGARAAQTRRRPPPPRPLRRRRLRRHPPVSPFSPPRPLWSSRVWCFRTAQMAARPRCGAPPSPSPAAALPPLWAAAAAASPRVRDCFSASRTPPRGACWWAAWTCGSCRCSSCAGVQWRAWTRRARCCSAP